MGLAIDNPIDKVSVATKETLQNSDFRQSEKLSQIFLSDNRSLISDREVMSYPPPNPNFSGGGNPQYNQPQVGSFGPPQPGGNPPGAGMGYSQQPGYGAPQGPPGGGAYGGAPGYGQPGGGSTYPGQGPGSFNPAGGPLPPPGGQRNMPPMGGGPPIMGPPGSGPPPPRSGQPGPGPLPPPQNRATFFSTASGAPIPSGSSIGGPPSSTNGGQAPPSFTVGSMAGGPPTAGPPGPGGPGSFYPGQTGGPPGGQMDGGYPPKPYGAAPNSSGFGMGLDTTQRQPAQNGAFPGTQSWGSASASVSTKEPTYDESQNYPNSLPLLNEIDLSCECNPAFMQATVRKIVVSQAAATASKIPIGKFLTHLMCVLFSIELPFLPFYFFVYSFIIDTLNNELRMIFFCSFFSC